MDASELPRMTLTWAHTADRSSTATYGFGADWSRRTTNMSGNLQLGPAHTINLIASNDGRCQMKAGIVLHRTSEVDDRSLSPMPDFTHGPPGTAHSARRGDRRRRAALPHCRGAFARDRCLRLIAI